MIRIIKIIALMQIFILSALCATAQSDTNPIIREIVIRKDTLFDKNKTYSIYEGGTELRLWLFGNDDVRKSSLAMFYLWHNGGFDGNFIQFYTNTDIPKVKGKYKDFVEDGTWYYWNKDVILTKKEIWKQGKLIKTIKYKTPQIAP